MKPIFDAKKPEDVKETRNISAFIQANILILLHPFIPFFTEKVWQDFKFNKHFNKPLMFKNWDLKPQKSFKKSYDKVDWLINLVTSIRSTKVNLDVSPGTFIEISIDELEKTKKRNRNINI